MRAHIKYLFLGLFFLSGFSGLIYESIWSHYLKLFLGHAAYAQTLVLIIFMGGLAIGSWLAAKLTKSRKLNLLLVYALIEGAIGVFAIIFHSAFVNVTAISFDIVIPYLNHSWLINLYKWLACSILIIPQCILLGATFPIMSAGLIRRSPNNSGSNIAALYFVNSLGACIGVLTSGFILIKAVGLPGTILTAGVINVVLACLMWLLVKGTLTPSDYIAPPIKKDITKEQKSDIYKLLLITACLTGTASFIYEVIWIRMLSFVLGSSTHAFELMLSAFILGLALGGLYIKNKIDGLTNIVKTLALIQLLMGLMAASTVLFYNHSFEVMAFMLNALQKNDNGYFIFTLTNHILACAVMLPTTFLAGMTLPLITKALFDKGLGEGAIGAVYAINTLGAILGVMIAVHVLLPYFGLKNSLVIGALIDISLALALFRKCNANSNENHTTSLITLTSLGYIAAIVIFGSFKLNYMSSGIYRHGVLDNTMQSIHHRDGKTASVDVTLSDYRLAIRTNGKPDAAVGLGNIPSYDESTMRMAAWIPMSLHARVSDIAIIGMGSGLTTHSALGFPEVKQVDTIEIEPAMVEGARFFKEKVQRTFEDPRSNIYIEDAKTFFTSHQKKYDLIISEPSNPWVSGVASLFTDEFYKHVKRNMREDALFAQWIQVYEMNDELVGSILKSISNNFYDYQIYWVGNADILVVAKTNGAIGSLSNKLFTTPDIKSELNRVGTESLADVQIRLMGDKTFFEPYLATLNMPNNSDYFPVVDQNAEIARFKSTISTGFTSNNHLFNLLHNKTIPNPDNVQSDEKFYPLNMATSAYKTAGYLHKRLTQTKRISTINFGMNEKYIHDIEEISNHCNPSQNWTNSALIIASITTPHLPSDDSAAIWKNIQAQKCYKNSISASDKLWVQALQAFSERNYSLTITNFNKLSELEKTPIEKLHGNIFYLKMLMICYIKLADFGSIQNILPKMLPEQRDDVDIKFLVATAIIDSRK